MKVRTVLRDCLYLNWALPLSGQPPAPEPLRYEVHEAGGEKVVFASAVLFRHQALRLASLPLPRLHHPQANFRCYVQDGQGVPSVLFRRMLVPAWVLPVGWLNRQPTAAAQFDFPSGVRQEAGERWRWSVAAGSRLTAEVRLGAAMQGGPAMSAGPRFSSWEAAVTYFRHRPRGYVERRGRLSRIDASQPRVDVWPLQAEVGEDGLAAELLGVPALPALHSAFLCPEVPMSFELAPRIAAAALQAPAPVVAADPARFSGTSAARQRAAA